MSTKLLLLDPTRLTAYARPGSPEITYCLDGKPIMKTGAVEITSKRECDKIVVTASMQTWTRSTPHR